MPPAHELGLALSHPNLWLANRTWNAMQATGDVGPWPWAMPGPSGLALYHTHWGKRGCVGGDPRVAVVRGGSGECACGKCQWQLPCCWALDLDLLAWTDVLSRSGSPVRIRIPTRGRVVKAH